MGATTCPELYQSPARPPPAGDADSEKEFFEHFEIVKETVKKLYESYPETFGPYGFYDSVNLEDGVWIGKDYLGIDKGITLLMIDNYYHGTTWKYYMDNEIIKRGLDKLHFQRKE